MKVKVYKQPPVEENTLNLKLRQCNDGVELIAVNETGSAIMSGKLLSITNDGTLILARDINDTLGLNLNPDGSNSLIIYHPPLN